MVTLNLLLLALLIRDSVVYGLFDSTKQLVAVCEIIDEVTPAEFSLLASDRSVSPSLAFSFMELVFESLRDSDGIVEVKFTFPPAIRLLEKAGLLKRRKRLTLA